MAKKDATNGAATDAATDTTPQAPAGFSETPAHPPTLRAVARAIRGQHGMDWNDRTTQRALANVAHSLEAEADAIDPPPAPPAPAAEAEAPAAADASKPAA